MPIFQFQNGAIKSQRKNDDIAQKRMYFNSKMVRLKDANGWQIQTRDSYFNSKMVRLKVDELILRI